MVVPSLRPDLGVLLGAPRPERNPRVLMRTVYAGAHGDLVWRHCSQSGMMALHVVQNPSLHMIGIVTAHEISPIPSRATISSTHYSTMLSILSLRICLLSVSLTHRIPCCSGFDAYGSTSNPSESTSPSTSTRSMVGDPPDSLTGSYVELSGKALATQHIWRILLNISHARVRSAAGSQRGCRSLCQPAGHATGPGTS